MKQFCRHVRENTGANDLLFGFITDTHFEENSDLRGYGANSLAHMRNFAAAGRECGAAFLINAGDMSNGNRPRKQTQREITLSAEAMRSGGLPVWFALGNHDDNTYYCKAEPADASNGFSGAEWQGLVYPDGFPAGTVAAPGVSNCFYVDFPAQKIGC
ncbi:MAG: metallophosphoesterase family protein [Victivallis sp.]